MSNMTRKQSAQVWRFQTQGLMHQAPAYAIRLFIILALMFVVGFSFSAAAQPPPELAEVWVTVQDYAVLRSGPGTLWERLTVLEPGKTLRATGRTFDGDWIQVAYTDGVFEDGLDQAVIDGATHDGVTYGWIAYWLLVWSGDILELPIDGVATLPFAREQGPVITIQPDMYYYNYVIDPSTRVEGVITEPATVEVIGRLGTRDSGYFWLQFQYNGQYFWTSNWEVGYPGGYFQVPDRSYLYAYGRLLNQLTLEINRNSSILGTVARRWRDLDSGYQVTCNAIPADAALRDESFRPADIENYPVYQSTVNAVNDAIAQTNLALEAFRTVCNRSEAQRYVTPEEVQQALIYVDQAGRNFSIARTILNPLQAENPLLGN